MAAVVAVVVIWGVAVIVEVVLAYNHIHQGQAEVQAARARLSANEVLTGAPEGDLRAAANSFGAAHSLLSSPLLWPVDVLPVAGRQLRSVQDLSGAAEQVARVGVGVVGRSQSLLRLPHTAGPDRIALLQPTGGARVRPPITTWPGSTWVPTRAWSVRWRTSARPSSTI